ncbi:MAG: sigma-70 family RNA polymerase sigma factor [Planctomycetota bacterium]|jgi:RNA polymerase sigma factor (sigma-70 family)
MEEAEGSSMREPERASDAELLAAWGREADAAALGEIARRYGRLIYGTCLRVLGDGHAAEDAAQGVLLVLMRKGPGLRPGVDLSAWLHRTARYAARDLRKTLRRRRRREEEAAAMRRRRSEAKTDPAEHLGPVLDTAISTLPGHQRRAVVLRYLAGRSEAEAAREMGCSRSSVSAALWRALGRLRGRRSRRGVSVSAAVLGTYLAGQASLEVPAALTSSLGAICSGGSKGGAAAAAAAKGVGKAMVIAKMKTAALVLGVATAVGGGGAITAGSLAAAGTPAPAPAPVAAKELPVVPAAAKAPTIDGALSDECWKTALKLDLAGYCDNERRKKGEKPKDATSARLLTSGGHLYLAFECAESHAEGPWVFEDARLKGRRGTPNSHVMGGDYVALALDMGRWGFYNYYVFAVNPKGELYKCFTWPHRYDLILRDVALPAAEAAAKIDKPGKRWTVEMEVKLEDVLRHPRDGFPKIAGVDLRRVQWGHERGKHKYSVYWTGMANVVGNRIKPQYERMATWTPLFETFPEYKHTYAAGRGWVQLTFPEGFGHVSFEAGKVENRLVTGQGARLKGLIGTRTGWSRTAEMRAAAAKAFDAPRMEYFEDLRPLKHADVRAAVVSTAPVRKPGASVSFAAKPKVQEAGDGMRISFKTSARTDATVSVLDAKGNVVRHLVSGVLGPNPPAPLKKDSLEQTVVWDRKDDSGNAVKAGSYRVKVCLGLKPSFDYAIPIEKNWATEDKTPTSKGLDVDNFPEPKIGRTLGHFSRGTVNYLSLDREREELYVQTTAVYDGKTGKKLRDLKLDPPRVFALTKGTGNGEISVSPRDGLLYVSGPNEVWRFTREGKAATFEAIGRNFIPELWGAHSNPHRGICAAPDGNVYKVHHYIPHTSPNNQVSSVGPDGRIVKYGFVEMMTSAAGVKVGLSGNVYVGCTVQPAEALPPKELAAKLPERPRKLFKNVYGSILKFGPEGGSVLPDEGGAFVCPDYKARLKKFAVRGAEWVHPGFAPMLSRVSDDRGGPGCSCRNGRFDLDDFERLFIPDAVMARVEVTDSNGNTILFIGARGEAGKKAGLELGWPTGVVASDEACYVADYLRFKISRVKLGYDAEEEVPVTVR